MLRKRPTAAVYTPQNAPGCDAGHGGLSQAAMQTAPNLANSQQSDKSIVPSSLSGPVIKIVIDK